jgi:hypothetical protein
MVCGAVHIAAAVEEEFDRDEYSRDDQQKQCGN